MLFSVFHNTLFVFHNCLNTENCLTYDFQILRFRKIKNEVIEKMSA